ncbi:MAG: PIN domain-containing protein [Clostridiales bacterium]|jgi:predicted nucleic acid-binding protein|nr:PIN domain-containing protein [Clostridiales bacterium]
MNKSYVLDACALIALVKEERGAEIVADLYEEARTSNASLLINIVNLVEVYYGFRRERGSDYADAILQSVEDSIVEIVGISRAVVRATGRIKSEYKHISLADSIALAEASVRGGVLVTSDHHELDAIDNAGEVEFLWIR